MLALTKEERLALVCLGSVLLIGVSTHYLSKINPTVKDLLNATSPTVPKTFKIDINRAGYEELVSIPHIGDKTAKDILHLRQEKGKIMDLNDIRYIPGIGKFKFDVIKQYLTITP